MAKRIIITALKIGGLLIALGLLAVAYWSNLQTWLYDKEFAVGMDTKAFIYYAVYYSRNLTWPHVSWDYLFFMGVPRILDMTFLHFYLIQPLINLFGVWLSVKVYPLITYAVLVLFSFLAFWRISKDRILATALAVTVAISQSTYYSLVSSGVFLSSISSMAYPLAFFCLVSYFQSKKRPYFYLGIVSAAFGIYSHGGNQTLFGLVPSLVFLLFATDEAEKIITWKSISETFTFGLGVLSVGALGIWPQLSSALKSSSYGTAFYNSLAPEPATLSWIFKLTSPSVFIILGIGIGSCLFMFLFKKIKPPRIAIPIFAVLTYYVLWNFASFIGINPLVKFLFVFRTMWFLPIAVGALSVALLARSHWAIKTLVLGIALFFVLSQIPKLVFKSIQPYIDDFQKSTQEYISYIADFVEPNDINSTNYRLWSHDLGLNNAWGVVYKMPLVEGSFHYYTREAEPWQGWFYGTLNKINWDTQEIPRDMAKAHSLFFIDWYATKYLVTSISNPKLNLADHFYESNDYISRKIIQPKQFGLFQVADNYVSPIVEPVRVSTIGFVGDRTGYEVFLKDIASLSLNTHFLVPIKYSQTIGSLCNKKISVDALILYDFSEGAFSSCGWKNIDNYVKNGGKIWIESTEADIKKGTSLPEIYPINVIQYNSLGKNWEPGGALADKIDFSKLAPLIYRNGPWKLAYAQSGEVKDGAQVLLAQKGSPVVVKERIGKGEVVWSGINLWYREEEYRKNGIEEVKPIRLILNDLLNLQESNITANVTWNSPERVEVSGKDFSGVVFKENYSSGWKARVISGNREVNAPVYIAGPGLMYVSIPENLRTGNILVEITYRGEVIAWIALVVSIISFLVIIDLIFGGHLVSRIGLGRITKPFAKINFSMRNWWNNEDEQ